MALNGLLFGRYLAPDPIDEGHESDRQGRPATSSESSANRNARAVVQGLGTTVTSAPPDQAQKEFDLVTIRLVLADDHVVLRQGLRALLGDEADLEVVGEADNGREAVALVLETEPDVLLVDLVMPETDGLAATRIIHEQSPKTRVLVLSSIEEDAALVDSVRAGAVGFLR
jgi:CheY-like chemotaxis protein